MSLDVGRGLYWLCAKKRDIVFRSMEAAADYVADIILKKNLDGTWEENFFEGLAKVERRDNSFIATTVSEEMFRLATIKLWRAKDELREEWAQEDKEIRDKAQMAVVKEYGTYRDGEKR